MSIQPRHRLCGMVTSVSHGPTSCRITIELAGTLDRTAVLMKESKVEWGLVEGAHVCVEADASQVLVGAYPGDACVCAT